MLSLSDWRIGIYCDSLVSCLKFFVINFKSLNYCLFLFVNAAKCVEELLSTSKETEKKENLHESEEYFWLFLNLNIFIQYMKKYIFSAAPPRLLHLSTNPTVCFPPFLYQNKSKPTKKKNHKRLTKEAKMKQKSTAKRTLFPVAT